MSLPRLLRRLTACLWLCLAAGLSHAACDDLDPQRLAALTNVEIAQVQTGLRTAFQDPNAALRDGRLGPYTRQRIEDLCRAVPRPPGPDDLTATLDLAREYAEIERLWPGWAGDLLGLTLLDGNGAPAQDLLGLRLAGPLGMKTLAIGRRALSYDCADPQGAVADSPDGARALATLARLMRDKTTEEICRMMPVAGDAQAWRDAMARLGRIASGTRTGALEVLGSAAFLRWMEGAPGDRLRRLVGTQPAVLGLLDEYRASAAPIPGATPYTSGPCSPVRDDRTLTYYSLDQADVDSLDFLISLTPKLEAFQADDAGFDNPQTLWRALRPVLAKDLDDCILDEIEALVKGPDRLPLSFLLKPAATTTLQADAALTTAAPVLAEVADLRTGTKAELVSRIRAGLEQVQSDLIEAQVAEAADTLAAASEPTAPVTDTSVLAGTEGATPPAPVITVTDAADAAVATAVDNPELAEALRQTPLSDVPVPELLRSQVRAALETTAARQVARAVDRQIALIEPAIQSEWRLTEALKAEILAIPYVQATTQDATADGAQERLAPLIGASYPSLRLFGAALRTASDAPGLVPFSPFVTERIIQKAQKTVGDPEVPRLFGPLEIDDCDCIPKRQSEDLTVYGFYPFWLAPTVADVRQGATGDADDTEPPAEQTRVDFSVVDRIAFYGLEFRADDTGEVMLFHENTWQDARRSFVNSAHRFRARADLAFDLRDWMDWDLETIASVVDEIAREMAPFDRLRGHEPQDFADAIPTLFDPSQPDGVTLIFHGYDGIGLGRDEMRGMIRVIKSVYEALPNRERLSVNVAFDFELVEATLDNGQTVLEPILDAPVFDDLFELLQAAPYVLADEDTSADSFDPAAAQRDTVKVIDKILLFLERPTTDAKKGLRFRMEQGLFQGELRRQVLRSIIPIVPPAGHREVRTSVKQNDPDQSVPPTFSQFEDDVVYFKDNFSGIGFWPVPDPLAAATQAETAELFRITAEHFNAVLLPPELAGLSAEFSQVCNIVCPNRAAIMLGAMALFASVLMLTWRSFYSGFVDRIAFRFLGVGMVWLGNAGVLGILVLLSMCDPLAFWPGILWKLLIAVLGILLFYNFIQRIKNGPMP